MAKAPVARTSASPLEESIAALRSLLPDIFSEGKVDHVKLREVLGDAVDDRPERYVFTWAGKREAIRLLQVPSQATLIPAHDESANFEATQHVFIEGENLEVLKLIYKSYFGRVKTIYIDPPYNTGGDFIYPDDFSDPLGNYLELTGQRGADGNLLTSNTETNGRYHSAWLTMMYPRLFVARQLLREDGIIFCSVDSREVHNLRLLMNDVFGEENFVEEIIWKNKYGAGALSKGFANVHEYILCYARSSTYYVDAPMSPASIARYTGRDAKYSTRGGYVTQPLATTSKDERPNLRYAIEHNGIEIWPDKQWVWSRERFEEARRNDEIVIAEKSGRYSVRFKQYLRDEHGIMRREKPVSILTGPYNQDGTSEMRELFGDRIFDFPKPSRLIQYLCSIATTENDTKDGIYLDFFAGSATLGQAIQQLNSEDGGSRRYICVQLPEPTPQGSPARRAGYETIADIAKERLRRSASRIERDQQPRLPLESDSSSTSVDLGFRVFKLAPSHFRPWEGVAHKEPGEYVKQMAVFADPLLGGWSPEGVIWEVAIKEGYGLTSRVTSVEDIRGAVIHSVRDPESGRGFRICVDDTLSEETVAQLNLTANDVFVCRDSALTDTLAANLALQCQLKTI